MVLEHRHHLGVVGHDGSHGLVGGGVRGDVGEKKKKNVVGEECHEL